MGKDIKRYLTIVSYTVRVEWVRPGSKPTTIFYLESGSSRTVKVEERMGKKNYWSCENCNKKIMGQFDENWWHIKHLLVGVGIGIYTEDKDFKNYKNFGNLTFCSLTCFITYLNIKFERNRNPSSR